MNLARSSLKLFGANVASAGIQFLGLTYFARELGAAPIGVFFLFEAVLGLISIPADFGLRGAVEKRISQGESQGAFLTSAIALKLVPIVLIILGILLLQSFINDYLRADVAVLLAIAIVLQEAARLSLSVLKGELRVGETAVLRLARQVTWVIVGAAFVSVGFEAAGLIYGVLAGLSVMLIWGWYKSSILPSRPSREHARSLIDFGKYGFISSVGGYFYSWMDIAIIGLFLTQVHVGAYEIAWRVTAVVMLLSNSIATAVFPQVSRWDAEDAKTRIESTIRDTITPSLLLVIPSFFGVLIFSREILRYVFGAEFRIAWLVLIVLMGEKLFQSVHVILGRSLQGIDRPDLAAYATVAAAVVNLVLNVMLILQFGIVGAAVATTLSFVLNTALHGYFVSKFVTIEFPTREVRWLIISGLGMALLLVGVRYFIAVDSLPRLLGAIGLGVVVYGTLLLLFGPLRRKLLFQIRSLAAEVF